eukprot:scaffold21821_cov51-Prasinocladus_malaysianus.AAC.1
MGLKEYDEAVQAFQEALDLADRSSDALSFAQIEERLAEANAAVDMLKQIQCAESDLMKDTQ